MSDMTPEKAQALLDPIEVDRLAVTSRAMGTVCDATGWQTSTARHHRNVADTLEAQAAELTRLRARIEAFGHALQHIDAMDPEARMISGVSADAARGLVLRMGEIARDALSAYEDAHKPQPTDYEIKLALLKEEFPNGI